MSLAIASIPVFADQPDTVFSSNQPLKASKMLQASINAKYGAVRTEIIYMGFFVSGNTIPLPVSPVDGYQYSQTEVQYSSRLYSTVAPGAGFTPGQKTPPTLDVINQGNQYYFVDDVDDTSGLVSLISSHYFQGGRETPTTGGIVKVYAICQRNDVTILGSAPTPSLPATLTPPASWSLSADLDGNLNLSFPIPDGVDYRFVQLGVVCDLEKNRDYPVSAGLTQLASGVTAYPFWQATRVYSLADEVVDPFGHIQKVTTAGTSGSTQPVFNESAGTVTDGTVVWTDQGYDTITVNSSSGFVVGEFAAFGDEVVTIIGPGAVGSAPTSTTWTVARAQALTIADVAVTGDFVYFLVPKIFSAAIQPGYTLDNPFSSTGKDMVITFRPGRMRILYASLQIWNATETTAQLEQSLDTFSFEPIVPNTLPGLRVSDGSYSSVDVFGPLSLSSDAASPLLIQFDASIGLLYATVDVAPTGADIIGQLYIQAPQIGDGVSFYAIGTPFVIPDGKLGTVVEWNAGIGYEVGALITDPAGHVQKCTVAGVSGGSIPTFNDSGGTTSGDGGVTWADQGASTLPVPQYYFSGAQLGNIANAQFKVAITQVGSTTPGSNLHVYITH